MRWHAPWKKSVQDLRKYFQAPAPRQARRVTPTQQSLLRPEWKYISYFLILASSVCPWPCLGRMCIVEVRNMKNDLQCLPIRAGEESVHVTSCPKNYMTPIPNCLKRGNHPRSELKPFRNTEIGYKYKGRVLKKWWWCTVMIMHCNVYQDQNKDQLADQTDQTVQTFTEFVSAFFLKI